MLPYMYWSDPLGAHTGNKHWGLGHAADCSSRKRVARFLLYLIRFFLRDLYSINESIGGNLMQLSRLCAEENVKKIERAILSEAAE